MIKSYTHLGHVIKTQPEMSKKLTVKYLNSDKIRS